MDDLDEPFDGEIEGESPTLAPGFHVVVDGDSLGCYPTHNDAAAFANGHLKAQGIDYEITEVS